VISSAISLKEESASSQKRVSIDSLSAKIKAQTVPDKVPTEVAKPKKQFRKQPELKIPAQFKIEKLTSEQKVGLSKKEVERVKLREAYILEENKRQEDKFNEQ
jgi:hypothetical protein